VRNVQPEGDVPILDVCTGTGDLALAYAKRTKGPVVGADFCHEMLDLGRQKADRAGHNGRMTFVEADTQELPFLDNTFQVVTVAFGLRNVSDTDRGLREMTRVCRPGGKVAVLEFSTPRWQPFKAVYQGYFKNILPRIGRLISKDASAYTYLPDSVQAFPYGEAFATKLREAGFTSVRIRPLTLGIASLYVATK
jgi:demethylmenaquinone methyltransferase/2-methoxy-6-polyprenyl-1,4-benzoquinol methylase